MTTAAEKLSKVSQNKELTVLAEIEKKYGKGTLVKFSDKSHLDVESISTGIVGLDSALGIGGFPRGRMSVIYGETFTGKSYLCMQAMVSAQKQGLRCAIIDTEHTMDMASCELLGVNIDELYISQPESANQATDVCDMLIRSKEFGLIVFDSVAAMAVEEEINGSFGDSIVGRKAKLMAQFCRRVVPTLNESNTCLLLTNTLIDNIGAFGYAETTMMPGGKALKFASSVLVELKKIQQVKDGDTICGHRVKATVKKNKVGVPFKVAEYEITYGQNLVKINELLELGVEHKVIEKAAAYYTINAERFQGKEKAKTYLRDNPSVANEIEAKIRTILGVA